MIVTVRNESIGTRPTNAIYFASEAKALLCVLPELREFDHQGVAEFLTYGCTLGERTLFRGIQMLPGGSLWSFENRACRKRKYFSPERWESQPVLSSEAFTANFEETFKRVLPRYFESQSTIGISLTGGLDSRMIMACRPDRVHNVVCYTFSGETGETFDDRVAADVAKTCGLQHRLLRIGSGFLLQLRFTCRSNGVCNGRMFRSYRRARNLLQSKGTTINANSPHR